MTDSKPVSVHARSRRVHPEETNTTRFQSLLVEQPPSDTVGLPPRAWNGVDAPTDGSHLLQVPLMTATDRRGSTVMADAMTVFGGNIAEDPEPLESTDRVVGRIRTDLVEASTYIRRLESDS